jgi:hypothetical protein
MKTHLQNLFLALALLAGIHQAAAQGTTAFTYQGQLRDGGTNANGAYTMIFKLYDAVTGGNPLGTNTSSPTLANGLFSVNLDFGAGAFTGAARWLDITVTNGGVAQTLSPRVQMLPTPYAQFAAVAATVTNNAIMNAQLAGNAVNTTNIQDSAITDAKIVSVSGSKVSGTVANAASLTNGTWSIGVGNFQAPNGGPLLANSLIFYAQGAAQALFGLSGGELYINDMSCATNHANAIRLNGSGSTITGDGSGGMVIFNPSDSGSVGISGGDVHASGTVYANGVALTSDRNAKGNFTAVDPQAVLDKVASLPVTQWNYKTDSQTIQHLGPMAQDFHAAFGLDGADDKHISVVDEGGVALAAIQGLNEKLKANDAQKDAQINALEKRLSELEQLVKTSTQK